MIESEKVEIRHEMIAGEDERTLSILREIGERGAIKAADALSGLIFQEISIEVPAVHVVSPMEIPDILQSHGLSTVVIIEQLSSNLECDIILVFTVEEAEKLVKLLLDTVGMEDIGEYQVLEEIGNILIGNFINALSDHTKSILKPTPPTHMVDYFDAILDNYVTRLLFEDKNATLFDTRLKCSGTDVNGLILMFLDEEYQSKIIDMYEGQ